MSGLKNDLRRDVPMKIRPHHGLCAEFFRGEGYSGEFAENMGNIISYLRENSPRVVITEGADEICSGCPNLSGGACSGEKAAKYDRAVLELCGISYGDEMNWNDFSGAVRKNIILQGKLTEICSDCRWFYICGQAESAAD